MNRVLLIVLCLSTLASCFVSRQRRVVNTEEEETETPTTEKPICSNVTPCKWLQYNQLTNKVIDRITNSYCDCKPNTVCRIAENDIATFAYIMRCLPPLESDNDNDNDNDNATVQSVPES